MHDRRKGKQGNRYDTKRQKGGYKRDSTPQYTANNHTTDANGNLRQLLMNNLRTSSEQLPPWKIAFILCCLGLVTGATVWQVYSHTTNPNKPPTNKTPNKKLPPLDESISRAICTDSSFKALNKPDIKVTLNPSTGGLAPAYCFIQSPSPDVQQQLKSACLDGIDKINDYAIKDQATNSQLIKEARQQHFASINLTRDLCEGNTGSEDCMTIQSNLNTVERLAAVAEHTEKLGNRGNAYELTRIALFKLLKSASDTNTQIKVQMVTLDQRGTGVNHEYLLLNSNTNDVAISGAENVADYLNNLDGDVCDLWNSGSYLPVDEDITNFYKPVLRSEHHFNQLKIETVTVDFSDLQKLPKIIKKEVCDKLAKLRFFKPDAPPICNDISEGTSKQKNTSPQRSR